MKIKISKSTLLLLAGVVFLALVVIFGTTYRAQTEEKAGLDKKITQVRQQTIKIPIAELTATEADLVSHLGQNDAKIDIIKQNLTRPNNGIDMLTKLFEIAEYCFVDITSVKSGDLVEQKQEGISFSSLLLSMEVRGDVPDLLDFVRETTREFPTSIVNPVFITAPGEAEEMPVPTMTPVGTPAETFDSDQKPEAVVTVNILSYEDK